MAPRELNAAMRGAEARERSAYQRAAFAAWQAAAFAREKRLTPQKLMRLMRKLQRREVRAKTPEEWGKMLERWQMQLTGRKPGAKRG